MIGAQSLSLLLLAMDELRPVDLFMYSLDRYLFYLGQEINL